MVASGYLFFRLCYSCRLITVPILRMAKWTPLWITMQWKRNGVSFSTGWFGDDCIFSPLALLAFFYWWNDRLALILGSFHFSRVCGSVPTCQQSIAGKSCDIKCNLILFVTMCFYSYIEYFWMGYLLFFNLSSGAICLIGHVLNNHIKHLIKLINKLTRDNHDFFNV